MWTWTWSPSRNHFPPWRDTCPPGLLLAPWTGPNGAIQMIITRPSEGLRSSSWVWSIQVDQPGTRETVPDRFRLIRDDFLMNILIFEENNLMFKN